LWDVSRLIPPTTGWAVQRRDHLRLPGKDLLDKEVVHVTMDVGAAVSKGHDPKGAVVCLARAESTTPLVVIPASLH
jgi:hypothetical protein